MVLKISVKRWAIIFKGHGIKAEFFKDRGAYERVSLVPKPLRMKTLRPFEKLENINLARERHIPVTRVNQQLSFSLCIQVVRLCVNVMSEAVHFQPSFDLQQKVRTTDKLKATYMKAIITQRDEKHKRIHLAHKNVVYLVTSYARNRHIHWHSSAETLEYAWNTRTQYM